jgi:hypothetical protein
MTKRVIQDKLGEDFENKKKTKGGSNECRGHRRYIRLVKRNRNTKSRIVFGDDLPKMILYYSFQKRVIMISS